MAQHIAIVQVEESGRIIKRSDASFAPVNGVLTSLGNWRERFPWLATVDEYGDTTYNYLQLPYFLDEIEQLKTEIKDEKIKQFIGSTQTHKYIKFIGD
jgi:hypothetical protein